MAMKRILSLAASVLLLASCGSLNINTQRALQGVMIASQALTVSDAEVQAYVHEYITQLDA